MNNLQHIQNKWYLERIRSRGLQVGDEIVVCPFNERRRILQLARTSYKFCYRTQPCRTQPCRSWDIPLNKVMDKDFNLQLKLIPDGDNDEGRYLLISHCETPFKINGNFCYQCFIERGDSIEFGLHQIWAKDDIKIDDGLSIPQAVIESELPILIEGETGTGKTHLVRRIYELSTQVGPFVHLNLSSFSLALFESELFGHVKGAFTGADRNKQGALLSANKGTLFIDEVDSLPRELQVKLLLFLDDGKVRPVGGERSQKVQTRLIVASGRNLGGLVSRGDIRRDFFFRIQSSYKIYLPSLRENRKKIKQICEQFAQEQDICFSSQLLDYYQRCPWPGNIRQLLGHLKTKKILSPSRKWEMDDFDHSLQGLLQSEIKNSEGRFLDLSAVKKNYVRQVFESTGRDAQLVSKILKISRSTLRGYVGRTSLR